ncbi:hypothetical protein CK203_095779 [Vitis vinifera]|uniref:Uncharacterized protein n=1 Tax=Vitis vinifera TaxID=29760 RepID=A0A438DL76_VITVI|nr:hypothetical protein CK203_095779 [Vitis vinifera]
MSFVVCDRRTPIPLSLCVGYGGFKLSLVKGGGGCFHLSYRAGKGGLKINLGKSELIPIGDIPNVKELALVTGCRWESLVKNQEVGALRKGEKVMEMACGRGMGGRYSGGRRMATWNPCFSRNFHDWEMDADQNFILKLNKFGRIRCEEDKMVWKASKSGALYEVYDALEAKGEVTSPSKIIWGSWAPIKDLLKEWHGSFVGKKRRKVWRTTPLCLRDDMEGMKSENL